MPKRPDGVIRAFGMSGAQITADIESIEKKLDVKLRTGTRNSKVRRLENYDQFALSIRKQAIEIAEFYEIFYCLENSIRKLISDTLFDAENINWWTTDRIPSNIQADVKGRIEKELSSAITARSENEIDYTTFGELAQIINKNWDIFEPLFSSQAAVQRVMFQLNTLRNPIAHCCPIAEDEKDRLLLTVKDWFRLMS